VARAGTEPDGAVADAVRADYPYCEACLIWSCFDTFERQIIVPVVRQNLTVDVHEVLNRSQGGSIFDRANLVAICRSCHQRATVNPVDAAKVGLHLPAWCNTPEHFLESERVRRSWLNGLPYVPEWV